VVISWQVRSLIGFSCRDAALATLSSMFCDGRRLADFRKTVPASLRGNAFTATPCGFRVTAN